jgi:hypothetical protein
MAQEPNWHKHVAIGTYILIALTVILILLAVLTFVHPPDPAHPVSFDFLSKSIVLPPWLALLIIALVISLTTLVVRRRTIPASPPPTPISFVDYKAENDALRRRLDVTDSQARHMAGPKAEEPPKQSQSDARPNAFHPSAWDSECKKLILKSPEGLSLEIDWYQTDTYGLLAYVCNNTADELASYRLEVAEAESWSQTHQKFLPNVLPNRPPILSGKNLKAIHKTDGGKWLLRAFQDGLSTKLTIGANNDQKNTLTWQTGEPTSIEIWRLTLAVSYDREVSPQRSNQHGLPPKYLLVRWDSIAKTIWMKKDES